MAKVEAFRDYIHHEMQNRLSLLPDLGYEDEPVYRCPNYPYCDEAPHALSHLQYEIEALRQRAALIEAHGAALARQEPNRPFVGHVY